MKRIITLTICALCFFSYLNVTAHERSKAKIQVALLLDTSNSMDGLIEQAKGKLWSIVNELTYCKKYGHDPNVEIALYEYGNDGLPKSENWIRKVNGFTTDLDLISEKLFALKTNGGSEYCGAVIQKSVKHLGWSDNKEDLKLTFIAGNESFDQGGINYTESCKQADKKDITINTIFCGDYRTGVEMKWREGAMITDGEYINIDHNQKVAYIVTPYDDEIYKLNDLLNDTYIGYGSYGKKKIVIQREQDRNARSYSKANAVERAVTKSSGAYQNANWDLVDAYEEDAEIIEELKDEQLPKELHGKSEKEIETYVKKKKAEREEIENKIQELQKKRTSYITKNQTTNKNNSLDDAIIKAVKKEATEKGFSYEK